MRVVCACRWQDEETSEYAAAAGIMARLAQQAAPQSRANAKLQKNKQKVLIMPVINIRQQSVCLQA